MRVGDEQSFVEFEFKASEAEGSPRAGDVACSVSASSDGFCGKVSSVWFSPEDIDAFLKQLDQLEKTRKGSASLSNLSSLSEYSPLTFEIFSIDDLGHRVLTVELVKISYLGGALTPLRTSMSFRLDGEWFNSVVAGFRKLFSGIAGPTEQALGADSP
jgi:hypothetical protein